MRRRTLIIIGSVALLVLVLVVRRGKSDPEIGATSRVERAAIERIVVASGTIEPEHLVEVRPKVSGIVERFAVDAGDRVKAGTVVAELDRETLHAAVDEATAAVTEATVARDHAAVELNRRQRLSSAGFVSKQELDQARTENGLSSARLDRAKATLDRLEQELAYATITAPIDGVVLSRDLNPGAAVASVASVTGGTILMTIADTSAMHLLGVVDENEIAHVAVGQQARIRTDSYPDRTFGGRVRKIASIGDRKENITSFKVEIDVLEGIDKLRPRMSADADIVTETRSDALIVPEAALVYDGSDVLVQVVKSGAEPLRRRVKLGISNGKRVEIVSGLSSGEVVKLQ